MRLWGTVLAVTLLAVSSSRGSELEAAVRSGDYATAVVLSAQVDPLTASAEDLLWKALALRTVGQVELAEVFFQQVASDATGELATRMTAMANLLRSERQDLLPANTSELAVAYISQNEDSPLLEVAFELLKLRNTLQRAIVQRQLQKWSAFRSELDTPVELPGALKGIPLQNGDVAPVSSARRALADYYLGLAAMARAEPEEAEIAFEKFIDSHPDHRLIAAATMRLAELRTRLGRIEGAREILSSLNQEDLRPAVRNQTEYLEARLLFAAGDYQSASAKFSERSQSGTILDGPFNAAIAAIYADDVEAAESYRQRLLEAPTMLSDEAEKLTVELELEQGLSHVYKGNPEAFAGLGKFIRDYPEHLSLADAQLALGELYLNQVPAQDISAREHLDGARELPLSLSQREILDYTAIWVEKAAGNHTVAIKWAARFLDHWPHSPRRSGILMMLGEAYYRAEEYEKSALYFQSLAREEADSSLAEPALFFAAKASARVLTSEGREEAVALWDEVVLLGGVLAAHARHAQGLLALEQDRVDDAIQAFDGVFELFPSRELRIAVLCDKGQAAYAKAVTEGNPDELLQAAMDSFRVVENDATASRAWRFQATTRRGKCLEALGQSGEALDLYYSVIESVIEVPVTPQLTEGPVVTRSSSLREEADWLHRAGFAAIHILQEREQWTDALEIADFLSVAAGPRAVDAVQYANRLRLKRFIWDSGEDAP